MVNKNGFLRIVEASIAVLIIFAAILLLLSRRGEITETDFNAILVPILEEIAKNLSLRGEILTYNTTNFTAVGNELIINDLENFVATRITNPSLNYSVVICELTLCPLDVYPKNINGNLYSNERVISTNLTESKFSPKKVKVFLWKKES